VKELIVLIPAHNESRNISAVVTSARKYLPVLVVDDGSTDGTASLAKAAGAKVLRQSPNQGKGTALLAGFRRLLKSGYETVITLDGDGQHDPAEIPKFLAAYRNHPAGLIIGQRSFTEMPFIRRLANTLGRTVFSISIGYPIADNQSGYRLIGRELMDLMLADNEPGFEFEIDMIVLALMHKLGIGWVPIKTIYTGGASHIRPLPHLVNFLRVCLKAHHFIRRS
jgi:glycosyltransferase involved in cell wall biosynthesis